MFSDIFDVPSTPRQVYNQENQTTAQKRANAPKSGRKPLADRTPRPKKELFPNDNFKFSYDLGEHIRFPLLIRDKNDEVKFVKKYHPKDPVTYDLDAPQYGDMFMLPEKDAMPSCLTIEEPKCPMFIDYI